MKYPIGIQDFESLRNDKYVYVDKTALVYELAAERKYIFLARPRRFGKSLLLSTIKAYFEGKKHLFEGLALARLEKNWTAMPVLMLSLARYNRSEPDSLEILLDNEFKHWENQYRITDVARSFSERFNNIIKKAHDTTGQRVVILIDEYDAPMVAHLADEGSHTRVRDLLKSVYVNIKDLDQHIRFAMLTGVSRFSRTSIFSGLNNLADISFDDRYSEICGITDAELRGTLSEGIAQMAQHLETDSDSVLALLKSNYDGYHFTKKSADIYNPFSLFSALSHREIGSYWFATGTPTFLVDAIHRSDRFLPHYFTEEVEEHTLTDFDTYRHDPLALMFQTGYLTIKGYDRDMHTYRLGLPNSEVRQGLSRGLLQAYMNQGPDDTGSALLMIRRAFLNGDPDRALQAIKAFLARIPYELAKGNDEIYFENNLYLLFNLIGVRTSAEFHTSRGRIDLLLEMPSYIYILELKLDGTARQALDQINEKDYALPFAADPRTTYKIGVNFSRTTRNIDTWLITRD